MGSFKRKFNQKIKINTQKFSEEILLILDTTNVMCARVLLLLILLGLSKKNNKIYTQRPE